MFFHEENAHVLSRRRRMLTHRITYLSELVIIIDCQTVKIFIIAHEFLLNQADVHCLQECIDVHDRQAIDDSTALVTTAISDGM